jgi:glycosyltransferase involved in cell wall biosynthesis
MRIIVASTALGPGGVWRHVCDLACGMRDSGHDVRIALHPNATEVQARAKEAGLPWLPLGRSTREPADIWHLHLHDTYDRLALPCLLARRFVQGATVVTEHLPRSNASDSTVLPGGRTPGAASAKWALKRMHARLAGRMIAVSDATQAFLCRRYGLTPETVRVVHCGVPLAERVPIRPNGEELQVAAVGSLTVQKGHDVLIRAAANARERWIATVVGSGPSRDKLERLAGALAPGRIRFAGWQDDPSAVMAAADVACLPSRWESFPYAALEAGAYARAVVASAVDGLPEIVDHGRTGYIVPPDDPVALARALDSLASQRDLVHKFGNAAQLRVAEVFPLTRMVEKNLALYAETLPGA